ncbi:MFS transporter [Bacillus sp. DNRA2]|uniref:MDR family MFS transporter n=1 Tax=Bacillus sp. DNRA2 TaxID=2723053 RepID=UPI00145F3828|nr:MFS transporter [Bacillus sp. DNRA2]NMD69760.1 MFS transporter [Bacillus sp. DNRA2]
MKLREWDRNLKIRLYGEALMNISFWMFFPFLTIYFAEEFGKDKAGLLLIFSQVFSVFANLMGGYCADRFGRKRMMVLSACGQGICFLVFGLANTPWLDSPWLSFVCYAFVGIFSAFYWPASQAMVADVVNEEDRNEVFAIFYTSINIAVVIGPLLGAIFYPHHRVELMLAAGVACILLCFILANWTRETAPVYRVKESDGQQYWYSFLITQLKEYRLILKDKVLLLFIIGGVLLAQTYMQLDLLIPVYTKDNVPKQTMLTIGEWSLSIKGEQAFGILLSENGMLVALLTLFITRWISRFKDRTVFIASSLLYALAIFMIGQTISIWWLIVAMAVFTLGELMTAGLQQTFISKLAPKHLRGQYFAAASLRYTIGKTIAPISIPLTVWIGYDWTIALLCFLAALSAVIFWVMFSLFENETKPKPRKCSA